MIPLARRSSFKLIAKYAFAQLIAIQIKFYTATNAILVFTLPAMDSSKFQKKISITVIAAV